MTLTKSKNAKSLTSFIEINIFIPKNISSLNKVENIKDLIEEEFESVERLNHMVIIALLLLTIFRLTYLTI